MEKFIPPTNMSMFFMFAFLEKTENWEMQWLLILLFLSFRQLDQIGLQKVNGLLFSSFTGQKDLVDNA